MKHSEIDFAIKDKCCFLRLNGELRYSTSSGFERFSATIFSRYELTNFVIDLSGAHYIDSTNLGILASIANNLLKNSSNKPLIISNNNDISIVLHSMGFEQFFDIQDEAPIDPELTYLGIKVDRKELSVSGKTMLEAHKALAAMNSKNNEIFKNVIELLEGEVDNTNKSAQ